MKRRLDNFLVERGDAETRAKARDAIRRGAVTVDGQVARKAGQSVDEANTISLAKDALAYVSRGGLKLAAALSHFSVAVAGRRALDVGASTGGFTDALLQNGAASVIAVDVGRNQLHPKLRRDHRVKAHDETDIRALLPTQCPQPVDIIVADVSFISLLAVLPAAIRYAAENADLIALIKPQFELGPGYLGKGGVVKDGVHHREAIEKVSTFLAALPDWHVDGVIRSPIAGGSGNVEFLIGAHREP